MGSLLLKNVRYLVSCDGDDRVYENVNVFIEGGWIRYIGAEVRPARDVVDARDMVVYPGLVNTHHHLYQVLTRNLPQVQNLELFDWLLALYEIWRKLDGDALYWSNVAGMAELLKNGCTTVFDHHYVFPEGAGDLIDIQFEAARSVGVRMVSSRGSMSLSRKNGGLPPDSVVQTEEHILKDSLRVIERFHDKEPGSMRQVVLAPCSPFSVSEALMRESALLARSCGVRLHTHLCETIDEENFVRQKTGMRPLEYMESLGWVGPDVWYAHGIHFNDAELRQLAATQTGVAHCPVSNMKLSSGVCRVPEMLKLGVPLGLAADGSASNDSSNLMAEMRVAYLLHRLTSGKEAPSAYDILKIATTGGAKVLGRTDIGHLAEGMAADLFAIRQDRLELAGAGFDPKGVLCTVGLNGGVDLAVVNGEVLVRNGRLCRQCEEDISRECNKAAGNMMRA